MSELRPFMIEIAGVEYHGRFVDTRMSSEEIQQLTVDGFFRHPIRYSDNDDSVPATIESYVLVNYFGTFIHKSNHLNNELTKKQYLTIDDYGFED